MHCPAEWIIVLQYSALWSQPNRKGGEWFWSSWHFHIGYISIICIKLNNIHTERWPIDIWKDVQHCYSPEKCKLKPKWDITSHLSETLLYCCWWEFKLVPSLLKRARRSLKKLKVELPYDPAIPLLGICHEEIQNTNLKKHMHTYVHCSIIYNRQDMEGSPD